MIVLSSIGAILALIVAIVFAVVQIFFLFQLTEAGINFLRTDYGEFFATANPLAWILVFVIFLVAAVLIRMLFRLLNGLAAGLLGAAILGIFKVGLIESVGYALTVIWLGWLVGCSYLTAGALEFFASRPELNGWLAQGGLLATVLVYLGILGLVYPSGRSED